MSLFAIQDRATGLFLPCGGSRAEFNPELPPRTFMKRSAALNSLAAWRQGHWRAPRGGSYYEYEQETPRPADEWKGNAALAAKRQLMDVIVVSVELKVIANV